MPIQFRSTVNTIAQGDDGDEEDEEDMDQGDEPKQELPGRCARGTVFGGAVQAPPGRGNRGSTYARADPELEDDEYDGEDVYGLAESTNAVLDYNDFSMFQEELVLPIGGLMQGFRKADRDKLFKEGCLYVSFVVILVVMLTMSQPVGSAFEVQDALSQNLVRSPIDPHHATFNKNFMKVANYDDLWSWVQNVLFDQAFQCCYYNNNATTETYGPTNDLVLAKYNRLITPVRFRQVRTKVDECGVPADNHMLSRPCWPAYSGSASDTTSVWIWSQLMPSSGSKYLKDLSGWAGEFTDGSNYGVDSHVVDLDLHAGVAFEKLKGMIRERWTDEWTRAVAIDVNTYNPNRDLATVFRFKVDALLGGGFVPHVEARSCRLDPYSNEWDYFRACLEVMFVLHLLRFAFKEVIKATRSRGTYFFSLWNYLELANLAFLSVLVWRWVDFLLRDRNVFKIRSTTDFHDLYSLCVDSGAFPELAAFSVVWSTVKLFKISVFYQRLNLAWEAMEHAVRPLLCLCVVILLFFLGFAFSGHWIFGQRIHDFHTWELTVGYLFKSIVDGPLSTRQGVQTSVFPEMMTTDPNGSIVWGIAWVIIAFVVLLNLFIAILVNSFMTMSARFRNRDRAEAGFEMPPWFLYFRSKLPCLNQDPDTKEVVDEMSNEAKAWRNMLQAVDREQLWSLLLLRVAKEEFDFEVADAMLLFPNSDEYESYVTARAWMKEVEATTGLKMKRTEAEQSSIREISVLTEKIGKMEEEILGLVSQLNCVVPKVRCTSPI